MRCLITTVRAHTHGFTIKPIQIKHYLLSSLPQENKRISPLGLKKEKGAFEFDPRSPRGLRVDTFGDVCVSCWDVRTRDEATAVVHVEAGRGPYS